MEEERKGPVCVTGGAGFLASWLIMKLLQQGYSVRATYRSDPKFKEDISHLVSLPEASGKLEFFEADLSQPESFEAPINGCVGVFHVAHPIDLEGKIDCDKIIKISMEGTLGILKACLKSQTVKRVVYTSSSSAAVMISNINESREIDESSWSEVGLLGNLDKLTGISYAISKTMTERVAIDFAKEHGLDLVTLLPSAILGPFIGSNVPVGFPVALPLIFGNEYQCMIMKESNLVHIDDVASAHIFLFECPKAEGRYICSSTDASIHDFAKLISTKYPEIKIPTELLSHMEQGLPIHLSSKKLLDLGFNFKYGLEEMIDGAIRCCKEKDLL